MKDNALYLEVDEDITSAIDKLTKSSGTSVQIVVPKRSTMLQSIINLKLLKKAAADQGKELVLVTNDRIASDLAGRVGLAVAPSIGAKPVIVEPEMPADLKSGEEIIEADDPEPPPMEQPVTKTPSKRLSFKRKPVTDGPPVPPPPPVPAPEPDATAAAAAVATDAAKPKKAPKVPNFGRLQRRVMWVGAAVLLIGGYTLGMYLFSSAKVTLYANGTKVDIDTTFAVDPNTKQTDTSKGVLAGQTVSVSKDLSGPFTPTGKKDVGTKASGAMTISNCYDGNPHTFVAGTRFTAPDGSLFRSTADVTVGAAQGNFFGCTTPATATVNVQADANGDQFNEGPASYAIPGLPTTQTSGGTGCPQCKISAKGAQMSGGTTKSVSVVTQSDVDTAKAALLDKDKDNAGRDLAGKMPSGYQSIDASQTSNVISTTPAPAVDAEGTTGTLSLKVTYTVLAVKKSDYTQLVEAQELKQVGDQNQIYDNGLSNAQVTATNQDSSGRQNFHFTTEAYGGTKLDKVAIAKQLAGKRFGDASDAAGRFPGVSKADIALWPGWSTSLPSRPGKITINISVATAK